jgi:hypothetical protein
VLLDHRSAAAILIEVMRDGAIGVAQGSKVVELYL